MTRFVVAFACLLAIVASAGSRIGAQVVVKQWEVFEKVLQSTQAYTNAQKYAGVSLNATFTGPGGVRYTVPGFWDGGTTWRVRFSPPLAGTWTYTIDSSDAQLDSPANDGSLTAAAPTAADIAANPNYRGFLTVGPTHRYLTYADGTPFFWMGDTVWAGNSGRMAWDVDPKFGVAEFPTFVADRKAKRFSAVQLLVWSQQAGQADMIDDNEGGPVFRVPFTEINPANFQSLDRRIQLIVDSGMVPVIFGSWGGDICHLSLPDLRHYWRYLVARYQAHNVIWSLSGEHEYCTDTEKVRQLGRYVDALDAVGHLTTIHPYTKYSSTMSFAGEPWLDFHMHQSGHYRDHSGAVSLMRHDYGVDDGPVVNGESGYDLTPDFDHWGQGVFLDRETVRRTAWAVYQSGAAGNTYGVLGLISWHDEPGDWWPAWYTGFDLPSGHDMKRIVDFYTAREWWKLVPRQDLVSAGLCLAEQGGGRVIVYLPDGGSTTVSGLPAAYTAQWYNPRNGSYLAAGAGPTFTAPDGADWVLDIASAGSPPRAPANVRIIAQ